MKIIQLYHFIFSIN